jgi:hypothetical protein
VRRALVALLAALALAGSLAGCSRSKEDLVRKAEGAKTRAELESRLGRPDDIAKLGPMERWTYRASNGEVVFVIVGDSVTLQATGAGDRRK